MRGKFTSSTLNPVFGLVIFLMLQLLAVNAAGDVFSAKQEIESLIEAGRLTAAQAQIEKLKADYLQDSDLPGALYWIGRRYEWSDRYDQAKNIYQQIIQNYPDSPFTDNANISLARQGVLSLIISGEYGRAEEAIDKLVTDFAGDTDLPDALYWIAERYRWAQKWEQANNLYNRIIQNYPDNSYSSKANLGIARARVLSLLAAGDYDGAQQALDELAADFTGHPDLPETLYWIAEDYKWKQKHEKAISIHQQIVQNYPDSTYASKSRLGLARTKIISLIENRQYEQADVAIEKMVVDFTGHQDLPETLYWIAEGFRWGERYEKAKLIHEQIVRDWPNSPYAGRAKLGIARIGVLSLLNSRDYSQAQEALDNMAADFSGHPDLPVTLYWIAERYRWSDKYEEARNVYQRIIQEYPQSLSADKARRQFRVIVQGMDVFELIESGQEQKAQSAIEQLMANPGSGENDEMSPYTVFLCGDRYYAKGLQRRNEGLESEAVENFTKAINVWEKMVQQLPPSTSTAHAYYRSANCYSQMRKYGRAIEQYVKLVENFPDYYLAWDAHFKIGRYYQKLNDTGAVDKSSADANTKTAYELILERYPDCPAAKAAENWLRKHAK